MGCPRRYPGQHEPILDRALWDSVQQRLRTQAPERRAGQGRAQLNFLKGKLFDGSGDRLTPSHAVKSGQRYRYHVSQSLLTGTASDTPRGWRLPAPEIERIVVEEVARALGDCSAIAGELAAAGVPATHLPATLEAARAFLERTRVDAQPDAAPASVLHRVKVRETSVCLTLRLAPLLSKKASSSHPAPAPSLSRELPVRLKRRGVEMRLVIDSSGGGLDRSPHSCEPDSAFAGQRKIRPWTANMPEYGLLWSGSRRKRGQNGGPFHRMAGRIHEERGCVAGGLGFEPRLTESESVVLPLDDPPAGVLEPDRLKPARLETIRLKT
jgi:hypothetical protein